MVAFHFRGEARCEAEFPPFGTYLHHPDFAADAARVQDILKAVTEDQIRTQVTTATTLG